MKDVRSLKEPTPTGLTPEEIQEITEWIKKPIGEIKPDTEESIIPPSMLPNVKQESLPEAVRKLLSILGKISPITEGVGTLSRGISKIKAEKEDVPESEMLDETDVIPEEERLSPEETKKFYEVRKRLMEGKNGRRN